MRLVLLHASKLAVMKSPRSSRYWVARTLLHSIVHRALASQTIFLHEWSLLDNSAAVRVCRVVKVHDLQQQEQR